MSVSVSVSESESVENGRGAGLDSRPQFRRQNRQKLLLRERSILLRRVNFTWRAGAGSRRASPAVSERRGNDSKRVNDHCLKAKT